MKQPPPPELKLFAPAEEINALTLGAVGSGTVLDHVEEAYGRAMEGREAGRLG